MSDASVFLAIILTEEDDYKWIIEKTPGCSVISPEILHYEIGNALIAMRKKGRLNAREVIRAFEISQRIPVKLVPVDIIGALKIAIKFNIYAYDAYYVQCCIEKKLPLISLDNRMCEVARNIGVKLVE